MTLATRRLRVHLVNQTGSALGGAKVTLMLSTFQVDGPDVVPMSWTLEEDPAEVGDYVARVWPNTRGDEGTVYGLLAQANGQALLRAQLTVVAGDGEAEVSARINPPPWPAVYAAEAAVSLADAYASAAARSAGLAMLFATGLGDVSAAVQSAQAAATQAAQSDAARAAFEDRVYPGVYSSPPAVKPHSGGTSAEGDRCTIRVSGQAYEHVRLNGNWIIPVVDAALLAAAPGAQLVGFQRQAHAGGAVRTVFQKLRDRLDIRDFNGWDGSGNNDISSNLQSAINEASAADTPLYLPSGSPVLGSTINVPPGTRIIGAGESAQGSPGTRIFLTHPNVGFYASGSAGPRLFKDFSTVRQQPNPADNWAPGDFDFDFKLENTTDVTFDGMMLYNPTRGISVNGGGRNDVRRLRMQPMLIGIKIDEQYDVSRIDTLQFWPFWSNHNGLRSWQMNNAVGVFSLRNDNPIWTNLFTIWMHTAIKFGNGTTGPTSKLKLSLADLDIGTRAIDISGDGHTAQLTGISTQGRDSNDAGVPGIAVSGTYNRIDINGLRMTRPTSNAIRVDGENNQVKCSPLLEIESWDTAGRGFPAIEVAAGNKVVIHGCPDIHNPGGTGPAYGGAGELIEAARENCVL